jgi:CheY-like chemotaxis protein
MALTGKRILLVEDEAMVAIMVETMLAELGATVVGPAATLARGLALAASEHFDAAVLDVNLREERVDEIAVNLKAKEIPFIFATGYGADIAKGAGVPVLDKPYTQEKLSAALAQALKSG